MDNITIDGLEVLTSEGYKDFTGIKRQRVDKTLKFTFNNRSTLRCTDGHLLLTENGFAEAQTLNVNDYVDGLRITKIEIINEEDYVYDLLNVKDTSHYKTNFVTSHNCAFVQGWTDFSASVLPTISSGKKSKLIFTSTPNGLNHFYDYYNGAKKGTNGFKLIEVKWNEVPGRDAQWKQDTLETINHDEQRFAQEYCVTGDTKITLRDKDTGIITERDIASIEYL